ncbi:ABC transporter ATP-binding protein [Entomohabitans teleogrylli]|uniref:ABC transporter ATP-binding protein n=1 Tax=Entomohabitans teleogrylli TaxID=1384589 RepID=UPI00073D4F37|nr:ABC transporter ATP-binding protein [Entomohabitans teleogrylli]
MIAFEGVSKYYQGRPAVADLQLTCREGEFTVLVGTSGSGKSTTLKMANRLVECDSGVIRFAGADIRQLDPLQLRRRMGYVIQSTGLFPHWTVARNIATVPELLKWPGRQIARRVDELLELLGLDPEAFRDRYPHQLSGGQQQRVGVARALAADPQVLLMDEPFGALDPVNRGMLQQEIQRIQRRDGRTIVLVTHDVDEALLLADRLVLMDGGRIVQQGSPQTLLMHPQSPLVTDFFGQRETGLRLLALRQVRDCLRRGEWLEGCRQPLLESDSLKSALSQFIASGCQALPVVSDDGAPLGSVRLEDVLNYQGDDDAAAD